MQQPQNIKRFLFFRINRGVLLGVFSLESR